MRFSSSTGAFTLVDAILLDFDNVSISELFFFFVHTMKNSYTCAASLLYMCRLTRFFGHNFFSRAQIALKLSEMAFLGSDYPWSTFWQKKKKKKIFKIFDQVEIFTLVKIFGKFFNFFSMLPKLLLGVKHPQKSHFWEFQSDRTTRKKVMAKNV